MEQYEFLGTGFQFPVEADPVTGRLKESSGESDIIQAISMILMTKKGERVMRPDFGCDIHTFLFDTTDYHTLKMMERAVTESLVKWEPRIRDIEVSAQLSEETEGTVLIQIRYTVRSTNNPYNLVYPFYLNEGIVLND